jgi:predicted negative regulator of RcsB-dependent stress response
VLDLISSDNLDKAAQMLEKEIARNEAVSPVFHFPLANIHFQREQLDRPAESVRNAVE